MESKRGSGLDSMRFLDASRLNYFRLRGIAMARSGRQRPDADLSVAALSIGSGPSAWRACWVILAEGCFDARQWLLGRGENPASECLDGRITQAIISDDKLIVIGPQFGGRDWANQTTGCDVRFNQVQRSQSDAQGHRRQLEGEGRRDPAQGVESAPSLRRPLPRTIAATRSASLWNATERAIASRARFPPDGRARFLGCTQEAAGPASASRSEFRTRTPRPSVCRCRKRCRHNGACATWLKFSPRRSNTIPGISRAAAAANAGRNSTAR